MARQKHPHLTNTEFKILGEYVRDVADKLGLRDWLLNLMHGVPTDVDPKADDAAASIQVIWGKKVANLWIAKSFCEERPERQRQFIVHELVHCHFDDIDSLADNELRTALGEIFWNAWHPSFNLAMEKAIDAVAEALAPQFPLIPWPEPKTTKN